MPAMATPWKHPQSGIYYLRIAVPDELRETIGKREIKKSLSTRNFAEAKACFAAEYASVQQLFEQHKVKAKVSPRDLQVLADRWLKGAIEDLELKGNFEHYLAKFTDGSNEVGTDFIEDALESGSYERQLGVVEHIVTDLVGKSGLFIVKGTEEHRELVNKLCWRTLRLYQVAYKRHYGDWTPVAESDVRLADVPLQSEQKSDTRPSTTGYKSLGDIVDAYCKQKRIAGDWDKKTAYESEGIFKLLLDSFGERLDPNTITREQLRDFVSTLSHLPVRYANTKIYKDLSLKEAIVLADQMGAKRLSKGSVRKKFVYVQSLFKFASQEEWLDKNRAEGLNVTVRPEDKAKKPPFTLGELKTIFKATDKVGQQTHYWMTRISLVTGMRSNEILQLRSRDIKQHKGVWYLDVNTEFDEESSQNKKAKRSRSIRQVPVPESLISIGFIDFVKSVKKGRLFADIPLGGQGMYSESFSKPFNKFLRGLGVKPEDGKTRKDFHTFRHTFRALAREHGVDKECADLLGGWKSSSTATAGDDYGKEYLAFLRRLKTEIDKVEVEL